MDDGGVDDRARRDANAFVGKMAIDLIRHPAAQIEFFQQTAETKDRGLVRRCRHAKIDSGEAPQHWRLIERLFHARLPRCGRSVQ